jgi:hypothetical protein
MTDAELKKLGEAATPGPWEWFGNTKMHEVYLATTDRGRVFVMDFARWGMRDAQPRFQVRLNDEPGSGIMRTLGELAETEHPLGPKFEVSYRRQFVGIGHPDASFIAAANPAVVLSLLARIERMEAVCAAAQAWRRAYAKWTPGQYPMMAVEERAALAAHVDALAEIAMGGEK